MLRPHGERILLRRDDVDSVSAGGIVLPEQAHEKPLTGTVVAVGSGVLENDRRLPIGVEVGERVMVHYCAGVEVQIDGVEHLVIRESDIVGVVT